MKTCLAKNPDERWQAAGDVKRQLEWIAASAPIGRAGATAGTARAHDTRVTWTVAVIASFVALIAGGALRGPSGQRNRPRRRTSRARRL